MRTVGAKRTELILRRRAFFIVTMGCIVAVALMMFGVLPSSAQDNRPTEYQIKAAFLFNFAKFVEWPPEALPQETSPIVIGVLGENSFGDDLRRTVEGKSINKHTVEVKLCDKLQDARQCHVLFVSRSEKDRLSEVFQGLDGSSVLTVSETAEGEAKTFVEQGGMINFVMEGTKIRFQINNEAARKARLTISSKLLSLAVPMRS